MMSADELYDDDVTSPRDAAEGRYEPPPLLHVLGLTHPERSHEADAFSSCVACRNLANQEPSDD